MSRKQKNITACFYLVIFCTICKNDIRKKGEKQILHLRPAAGGGGLSSGAGGRGRGHLFAIVPDYILMNLFIMF